MKFALTLGFILAASTALADSTGNLFSNMFGTASGGGSSSAQRSFVVVVPPESQNFKTGGSTANTLISFTTVAISSTSVFAAQFNTSNSTFTASATGTYNFRARLTGYFPVATANSLMLYYFYKSSNPVVLCAGAEADTNNYNTVDCNATLELGAGDVITMKYSAQGAAYELDSNSGIYSQLYIEKIK